MVAAIMMISVVWLLVRMGRFKLNLPFYFGGTSLLIAVGVGMDTVAQVESHLITRNYDGFLKGVRIRGRR